MVTPAAASAWPKVVSDGRSCYSSSRERASSRDGEGSMNRNAISRVRLSRRTSSIRIANLPGCPRISRKPSVIVPTVVCGCLIGDEDAA